LAYTRAAFQEICLFKHHVNEELLTEGRVGYKKNAFVVAVRLQVLVGQARVHLNLIDCRDYLPVRTKLFESLDREVRNSDGLDLAWRELLGYA
jgi:hypothetical protein